MSNSRLTRQSSSSGLQPETQPSGDIPLESVEGRKGATNDPAETPLVLNTRRRTPAFRLGDYYSDVLVEVDDDDRAEIARLCKQRPRRQLSKLVPDRIARQDPRLISTSDQLASSVSSDPVVVYEFFDKIRRERDLLLSHVQNSEDDIQTMHEQVEQLETENQQLKIEQAAHEVRVRNLEDRRRQDNLSPAVNGSPAPHSRKKEIPHPDKFNGDRVKWKTFKRQIYTKLRHDRDLYPTDEAEVTYAASRLDDEQQELLESYYEDDGRLPSFGTLTDFFEFLDDLYLITNQFELDATEYDKLRMKHPDEFMPFYIKFTALASKIGYLRGRDDKSRIIAHDFERRLPARLIDARTSAGVTLDSLAGMKDYYVKVDQHQRSGMAREEKRKQLSNKRSAEYTSATPRPTYSTRPVVNNRPTPVRQSTPRAELPAPVDTCWSCGEKGHRKLDCPRVKREGTGQINEADVGSSSPSRLDSQVSRQEMEYTSEDGSSVDEPLN